MNKIAEFELKATTILLTASIYIGEDGEPVALLYNYLKPFPERFKKTYFMKSMVVKESPFSLQIASLYQVT